MSSNLRELWSAAGGNTPEHWEFKTIEELLAHPKAISVGVMYPGTNAENGIPLVRVSDVKNGAIVSKPEFGISLDIDEEYKRTRLDGSELLITLVGNPGDCVVASIEMAGWNVARALAVVRLRDIELRSWLRYTLLSGPAKHLIGSRLNTTVQKTLNLKDIRELGIPIPPDKERQKIVDIIDAIESKANINTQTNQTLESIAQAIFKSWFVDFEPVKAKMAAKERWYAMQPTSESASPVCYADEAALSDLETYTNLAAMCAISGKSETELAQLQQQNPDQYQQLAETAALFPSAMVNSELGEIPEGWEVKQVGDYLQTISKTFPLKTTEEAIFLNTGDIQDGRFLHKNKSKIATLPGQAKKSIQKDDILYSEIRPENKRFAYVYFEAVDYVVSTKLMVLRTNGRIDSKFLYFLLRQQSVIDQLQMMAESRSGTFPQITFDVLSKIEFLAPKDHQVTNRFAEIINSPSMKITNSNIAENSKLAELRDSLLPKLLSGELSISVKGESREAVK